MSFDVGIDQILQYATNFLASAFPVVRLVLGISIAAFAVSALVSIFRRGRA